MDGRCGYYKWNNPENSNTNSQLQNLTTSLSENACTWHAHMYAQTDEQVKNIMLPLANSWAIGDIKILKTVLQHFMSEVCGWPLLTEYPPTWSLASVAESASRWRPRKTSTPSTKSVNIFSRRRTRSSSKYMTLMTAMCCSHADAGRSVHTLALLCDGTPACQFTLISKIFVTRCSYFQFWLTGLHFWSLLHT